MANKDTAELLLVSAEYGPESGAEGLCTWRLKHAVQDCGTPVEVLASKTPGAPQETDVVYLKSSMSGAVRLQFAAGFLATGCAMQHWDWALRASRFRAKPAAVYARAHPIASLVAASRIARARRAPLIAHFSDPIPCPWDRPHSARVRNWRRVIGQVLHQSAGYTFTTREAAIYMESIYGMPLLADGALIRNIVPAWNVSAAMPSFTSPEI